MYRIVLIIQAVAVTGFRKEYFFFVLMLRIRYRLDLGLSNFVIFVINSNQSQYLQTFLISSVKSNLVLILLFGFINFI